MSTGSRTVKKQSQVAQKASQRLTFPNNLTVPVLACLDEGLRSMRGYHQVNIEGRLQPPDNPWTGHTRPSTRKGRTVGWRLALHLFGTIETQNRGPAGPAIFTSRFKCDIFVALMAGDCGNVPGIVTTSEMVQRASTAAVGACPRGPASSILRGATQG